MTCKFKMIYTVGVVCEPPLLPVYSEQMPKVKVRERASLKPTRLSRSVMTFPCGTTLMEAGR